MSDFSELNNNNYMPGFYGEMNSIARHNLAAALNGRGNTITQTFTFTSPSNGSSMSSPRPSIQTNSQMGYLSAPGVGTAWQHSVPTTMPWSTVTSSLSQHGTAHFADPSSHPCSSFHAILEPQPSCSSPMKRPKRKAIEYSEDAPMSKVYLCADQFANLQISPDKNLDDDRQIRTISYNSHHPHSGMKGRQDLTGWERFREVENSINTDLEDNSVKSGKLVDKQKGVLHLDEIIQEATSSTSSTSILPKSVLNDITKPCLQVVIWKSPGQILRDVVKEEGKLFSPPTSLSMPSSNSESSISTNISRSDQQTSPHIPRDSVMEDIPWVPNVCDPLQSSPTMHFSANSCLLSPSVPSLNWLHPSSQNLHQLHLASSNQSEMPFDNQSLTGCCDSLSLDDDMQL